MITLIIIFLAIYIAASFKSSENRDTAINEFCQGIADTVEFKKPKYFYAVYSNTFPIEKNNDVPGLMIKIDKLSIPANFEVTHCMEEILYKIEDITGYKFEELFSCDMTMVPDAYSIPHSRFDRFTRTFRFYMRE